MSYVVTLPLASVRGDAYVRVGANPEDLDAWVVIPHQFEVRFGDESQVGQVLDPATVRFFGTRHEALAWRRARTLHQRKHGKRGPTTANVRKAFAGTGAK